MSKIGKKPIIIPSGIEANINGDILEFKKGPETTAIKILPFVKAELSKIKIDNEKEADAVVFSVNSNTKQAKANWGTLRALTQNIITGLEKGFTKELEIEGVGFRAVMEGNNLVLHIGYSHPVKFIPPEGVKISVEKNTIVVTGKDKYLIGQAASEIRAIKKPEPYKGKGIRYKGEHIRRKAGKKTGAAK